MTGLENPARWGGLAALITGVLLFISRLLNALPYDFLPFKLSGSEFAIYGFLGIDGYVGVLLAVMMQLGLVGLYVIEAEAAGALGVAGFFMAFIGARAVMVPSFIDPIAKPSLMPSGGEPHGYWWWVAIVVLGFVGGWVLFGIGTLRAGIYPRVAALLLIIGAVVFLLPLPLSGIIFAVAVAWMGYVLFTGRRREEKRA